MTTEVEENHCYCLGYVVGFVQEGHDSKFAISLDFDGNYENFNLTKTRCKICRKTRDLGIFTNFVQ